VVDGGEAPRETAYLLSGAWFGGLGGGSVPIVRYDSTANDSMDYEYLLLPTMGESSTGAAQGITNLPWLNGTWLCGWSATWDGVDSHGRRAGSGIYFLRLKAGKRAVSRKAVFLR
jgi:hypothetical protein